MQRKRLLSIAAGLVSVCALVSLAVYGALPGSRGARGRRDGEARAAPVYASYLQVVGVKPMDFDRVSKGSRRDGAAWVQGEVDLDLVRAHADAAQAGGGALDDDVDVVFAGVLHPHQVLHGAVLLGDGERRGAAVAQLPRLRGDPLLVAAGEHVEVLGRVVYARPNLADDADDECHAYADCVARNAWLGRESPLPADAGPLHGFKAGDVHFPVQGGKAELRAGFQDGIDLCKRNLLALSRLDQHDPIITQNITLNADLLEQLEWLMSL